MIMINMKTLEVLIRQYSGIKRFIHINVLSLEQILTVKHWLTLKQKVTKSKLSVIAFQKAYELNK